MALLKKLFSRGEPAPELQIHPEDLDLVTEADRRWWSTLALEDCRAMEEQDNVFKVAALAHYIEDEGLEEQEAARKVRKSFPAYYAYLKQRQDEHLGFGGQDAKLPYMIKDRVNRAVLGKLAKIDRIKLGSASSVNALVRTLIRQGRI